MTYGKTSIVWSIKEFSEVLRSRQLNKYDVNIGVSGKRGDGKSTFIFKLLSRFKGFKPKKHQVYIRDDVVNLLRNQQFSFCWDDEAINSGYKRDFQNTGQKELIKIITAYRDNFNIYASAIPFFYSLDKDLRELIFVHVNIIERGFAVILMPLRDNIHQTDPWDTKNNAKKEEAWQLKKAKDPSFKFPYHKLSTFAGYLKFTDITPKQRNLYESIKKEKRQSAFEDNGGTENKELSFHEDVYIKLKEGKLSKEGLLQICSFHGKKYHHVLAELSKRLKEDLDTKTPTQYLVQSLEDRRKKSRKLKKEEYMKQYYKKNRKKIITQQKEYRKKRGNKHHHIN